jgi:hypothetical protein
MRNDFIKKLIELAKTDQRIVLLTADLGFSVVEEFQKTYLIVFTTSEFLSKIWSALQLA